MTNTIIINTVILLGLANWRLASLLAKESGPFHIFKKLRELTGIKHDQQSVVFSVPEKFWAELISCVWCTSVWTGIFWAVLFFVSPKIAIILALPLALSSVAVVIESHV